MTNQYKIEHLSDSSDCETCGTSYATGYVIYKGEEVVVDKTPYAHCYSGSEYYNHNPFYDILKLECPDIVVMVDDGCQEEYDYGRDKEVE